MWERVEDVEGIVNRWWVGWGMIVVKWSSSFLFGVGPLAHTPCTKGICDLG